MGLFGGSKSSSSVQNITEVDNVGASEGSLAANENSAINVLDAGAIERAFDFGGSALAEVGRSGREAFDFGGSALAEVGRSGREAFDFGGSALDALSANANRTLDAGLRFARESLGLVERNASAAQSSFEGALSTTLANLDDEQSGGAQRLLWLAGASLLALLVFGYFARR